MAAPEDAQGARATWPPIEGDEAQPPQRPARVPKKKYPDPIKTGALVVFQNKDKKHNLGRGKDPRLPPVPGRVLFCGPPGSGKLNSLNNLLVAQVARGIKFKTLTVIHLDAASREYETTGGILGLMPDVYALGDEDKPLPDFSQWTPESGPHLLCIDEVVIGDLPKKEANRLERLFSYASTHKNLSIYLSMQTLTAVPPAIRRAMSWIVLFPGADLAELPSVALRSGIPVEDLRAIFDSGLLSEPHSSLTVDLTAAPDSKFRLRKNLFFPVVRE